MTRGDVTQPGFWSEFFESAKGEEYSIYCHPKEPGLIRTTFLKNAVIEERVETGYGSASILRATLVLLREAYKDPANQFFALLSESCIPLHMFGTVRDSLSQVQKSLIGFGPTDEPEIDMRWRSLTEPGFVPREQFFKQHQWMVLHRDAVEFLLEHDHLSVFEGFHAPDEHYVISVMVKHGFPIQTKVINHTPTFVNWAEYEVTETMLQTPDGQVLERRVRPKTYRRIVRDDLVQARRSGRLFFRKVAPDCDFTEAVAPDQG